MITVHDTLHFVHNVSPRQAGVRSVLTGGRNKMPARFNAGFCQHSTTMRRTVPAPHLSSFDQKCCCCLAARHWMNIPSVGDDLGLQLFSLVQHLNNHILSSVKTHLGMRRTAQRRCLPETLCQWPGKAVVQAISEVVQILQLPLLGWWRAVRWRLWAKNWLLLFCGGKDCPIGGGLLPIGRGCWNHWHIYWDLLPIG